MESMKRKLVKQGVRALTITLPAPWVEKHHLHQGDEIELVETEDSLLLTTEQRKPIKEITVDVSGLIPRMADRFMARAYQKGYDKITVKFDTPELMLAVKNKIQELMGFEILNIDKNMIEAQVVAQHLDLDFDTLLRRAMLLLMDMARTCHDSWKSGDKQSLENIFHQDFDVNRFTYFCLRELNKNQTFASFGRSIIYYLIESLEDLGDELKALGKLLSGMKQDKEILALLEKMNELFRMSYEFFYKPEKKKAVKAFLLVKEISSLIESSLDKKNKDCIKALTSIDFSTRIIYHLTTMRLDTLKELSGQ